MKVEFVNSTSSIICKEVVFVNLRILYYKLYNIGM